MTDQELLSLCNERLSYNPDTGVFIWTNPLARRLKSGDTAGSMSKNGYMRIAINGKRPYSHRLAFLITHGYLPKYIDHINGIRSDNRISNLRECTISENNYNTGAQKGKESRYKGIKRNGKNWGASISSRGVKIWLGTFACEHKAARVWNTAARMYHGEFSYTNVIP